MNETRARNARWGEAPTGFAGRRGAGRAPNFLIYGVAAKRDRDRDAVVQLDRMFDDDLLPAG